MMFLRCISKCTHNIRLPNQIVGIDSINSATRQGNDVVSKSFRTQIMRDKMADEGMDDGRYIGTGGVGHAK